MATYYIDYKNGNDATGNGSSGTPYKTLTKALTVIGNDDTILARGSDAADEIYYEYAKSTTKTGVTIAADTGHTPTWTPATAYTSWALTAGQNYTYETAYTPAACWYCWNGATLLTEKASIAEVEATADTWYADVAGDKLYVHIAGGGSPTTIHACMSIDGLLTSAGANISYNGLRCQWCGGGFYFNGAGSAAGCAVRYHGGNLYGNRQAFDVHAAAAVTLTGCSANGQIGVLYGTTAYGITTAGATLTVTGCTADSVKYGVLAIVACTVTVDGCTFSNCMDGASFIDPTAVMTVTVKNCTMTNYGHCAVQFSGANITGTAHHNTAYYSGSGGQPYGYVAEVGATGYFYHNVVYGLSASSGNGLGFYILSNATTAVLKNNIAMNCKVGFAKDGATNPTITSDYNDAYGCTTANYSSSGDWPEGAHDLQVDPLFVNPENYDFRLDHRSPCIDAGVLVTGINEGFRGAAPDIGEWEYVRPVVRRRGR